MIDNHYGASFHLSTYSGAVYMSLYTQTDESMSSRLVVFAGRILLCLIFFQALLALC